MRIYNKLKFIPKTFILGDKYKISGQEYRFIKVTPKGYNFVSLKTHKCLFRKHFYDRNFYNKPLPRNHKKIKTWVPDTLNI